MNVIVQPADWRPRNAYFQDGSISSLR